MDNGTHKIRVDLTGAFAAFESQHCPNCGAEWLALFFNRVGKAPLYPFEIAAPVVRKLGFVHRVIRETASNSAPLP